MSYSWGGVGCGDAWLLAVHAAEMKRSCLISWRTGSQDAFAAAAAAAAASG